MPVAAGAHVIGGGGPGGISTALRLAQHGLPSTVLELGQPLVDTTNVVLIRREGVRHLRDLGAAGHILRDTRNMLPNGEWVAPLSEITNGLRATASERGIEILYGADPVSFADGVLGFSRGGRSYRGAASAYVDATGGRSALLAQHGIVKVPHAPSDPTISTSFVHAQIPYQPSIGTLSAARAHPDLPFALNHTTGGMSVFVPRRGTVADLARRTRSDDAARLQDALRALQVTDPSAQHAAEASMRTINVRQALIDPGTVPGDIIPIGDSVATTLPVQGYGTTLAIRDGIESANTLAEVARDPRAREDALAGLRAGIYMRHRLKML